MTTRKDFIKKACISSACLCGFASMAKSSNNNETEESAPEINLHREWVLTLLENIEKSGNESIMKESIKSSAITHYQQLNMDEVLKPFIGNIEKFIEFLSNEWGWIIEYDRTLNKIIANENKKVCVCPILPPQKNKTNKLICYCSEGFAEIMFSKVLPKKVQAEVISSIHRGNEKCIYQITI